MKNKILATVLCVLALCGASWADGIYSNGINLVRVKSDGTEEVTSIADGGIFSFNHNGKAMMLVAHWGGDIEIYAVDDLTTPVSTGNISSNGLAVSSVAELGSNIVLAGMSANGKIIELNPETCEVVGTYNLVDNSSMYQSSVYGWNGNIIASYLANGYSDEQGTVMMDSLGHITGQLPNMYVAVFLEASGGELYAAIGTEEGSEASSSELGVYRVSEMVRSNMDFSKAQQLTHDNPFALTRDGNGGLYYSVGGTDTNEQGEVSARYIYHWNKNNSVRVYDAGTQTIGGVMYDINAGILYAEIYDDNSYTGDITALTPNSSGQLQISRMYTANNSTVIGNPPDSSSSSGGGNTTTPKQEATTLITSTIEPIDLTESTDVLDNLVALIASIDKREDIHFITQENLSSAQEPTQSMREYMRKDGYDSQAKLNTVTVNSDGYYVMLVNIPDELIGLDISQLKMYALKPSDFSDSSAKSSFFGLINGILNYGELTTLTGQRAKTTLGKMLAIGLLQASQPFTMFLAKAIMALLGGGGGCTLTGAGIAAMCALVVLFRRNRR